MLSEINDLPQDDPAPIRHSLPRPSPTAPNEPSTIQRRPKAALPRRRLAERHVVDANWLETSPKPLKLSARHPGTLRRDVRLRRPCRRGRRRLRSSFRWLTREFSDRSRRACSSSMHNACAQSCTRSASCAFVVPRLYSTGKACSPPPSVLSLLPQAMHWCLVSRSVNRSPLSGSRVGFFRGCSPSDPTPEKCVKGYYLQRIRLERVAERKLRRRQLTDVNVAITGHDLREREPAEVS